jgi:hypothetical protein
LGRKVNGLLSRPTLAVNGRAWNRQWVTSCERCIAGNIHGLLTDGHRATHDHVFNQRWVNARSREERSEWLCGEIGGVPTRQHTPSSPDWSTDSIDDHGSWHTSIVADLR